MPSICVGTVTEIKDNENRVGLTPLGVKQLVADGHKVLVQRHAGKGAGFHDRDYTDAGAEIRLDPESIARDCNILVKVKEPLPSEYHLLELLHGKALFTYLHLSGVEKSLTEKLIKEKITGIAYETVQDKKGGLPLLSPMSEIAGVLAIQYGAEYLQKKYGGRGKTLGEISGVDRSHVVVIGAGVVGKKAAKTAAGMGCQVSLFDVREAPMQVAKEELQAYLGEYLFGHVTFHINDEAKLDEALADADVLVGAVLVTGAKAPKVVNADQIHLMKDGAVVVDVAIDQGGCVEGARATTHSDPIYMVDGKIFCCVANMPGQVAHQSTVALTNATLPYLRKLANETSKFAAFREDSGFARGLNTFAGKITYQSVAKDLHMEQYFEEVVL
ncbi:MAG: alanine dehydrogenase [bacterium]|nr:alanine dehydrogenase [bacterium]